MLLILRRKRLLGFIFVPLFFLGGAAGSSIRQRPPVAACVLIDPGHGGIDGGCQDSLGYMEKDINLGIAGKIAVRLRQKGVKVHLTREDDRALGKTYGEDLLNRLQQARRLKPQVMLSIHANWHTDPSGEGAVTVIPANSKASAALAKIILAELGELCYVNPNPIVMPEHQLLATEAFPIVLIEVGFLSNPEEASRLHTAPYQEQLGRAISEAVLRYLHLNGS